MNGIIIDGKVYEFVAKSDCGSCAFDKRQKICRYLCDTCIKQDCAFRFSQELTDKLNDNE